MAIEIFWGSGSPFSWRALLTAEVKGVRYESRLLEFSKGDHKSPSYLEVNPRGKVPALRDGNYVLAESLAIMAYLDKRYPEPALFGQSPGQTGRIWQSIMEFKNYAEPLLDRIARPLLFGNVDEQADDIQAAAESLRVELAGMEEAVAQDGWFADDSLSAADIASYTFIEFLLRITGKPAAQPLALGFDAFAERYPALEGWRERIRELPGYDRAYPPHWREA